MLGIVLVDQDGVLADFERGVLDAFRARYPGAPFIELTDRRGFYVREQYPPEWADAISQIVRGEGFYRGLPVIKGGPAALEDMLKAGHDVFLCTTAMASSRWSAQEKLAWIEQHLGRSWVRRTVFTHDKTLVGDRLKPCVLIDDRPRITGAASPPWTHVLFDAPYNRDEAGPRLSSWAGWRAVLEPILAGQQIERGSATD